MLICWKFRVASARDDIDLLSSLVVLGTVLEDAGELDVVELAVLDGRLLEEVVDLVAAEPLPHRHQDVAQVVLGQTPCEHGEER